LIYTNDPAEGWAGSGDRCSGSEIMGGTEHTFLWVYLTSEGKTRVEGGVLEKRVEGRKMEI